MHIYDYIIIGSGLTGLTIAKKLSTETENILVLEAQESAGGDNRPTTFHSAQLNNGIRFMPTSEASKQALNFLGALLQTEFSATSTDNEIETYESGQFKKFVGFGDKSPEFYQQLSFFLSAEETVLQTQPYQWVQTLLASLQDKILTKSIVTRFGFEGLDSEKPVLTHVMVNGSKTFYARNFIFTGSVKDLNVLLPDDVLNPRAKAKLKKSAVWQAVCLDLLHTHTVKKNNLFLLNGTTDDEIGPCIGRFLAGENETPQVSQWISFIDSESAEDTENIGLVLKKMKRQIRRAFPEVADSIQKERIFVTQALSAADLKLNARSCLPKVDNLWVASSQMSAYPNLLGSLMQVRMVLSALGFSTGYIETPSEMGNATEDADLN